MSVQDKLDADLKTAMKARDADTVNTLRLVRAQLKDSRIAKGDDLDEEEVMGVLMNAAKKRKEAIEFYEKGGRKDLLQKETAELEIISRYLPKQLSGEEIVSVVEEVIQQLGATTINDLGKVMGAAMKQLKGKADGKLIQEIVREKLS